MKRNEKNIDLKFLVQDNGNGYVKTSLKLNFEEEGINVEPSVVSKISSQKLSTLSFKDNVDIYEYKGQKYFFGQKAIESRSTSQVEVRNNTQRYQTEEYLMTSLFAISNIIDTTVFNFNKGEENAVWIKIGLMLCGYPHNQKIFVEKIAERFTSTIHIMKKNNIVFSIEFEDVVPIEEPEMAAIYFDAFGGNSLIIDIGTETLDVIEVIGDTVSEDGVGTNIGMRDFNRRVSNYISSKANKNIPEHEIFNELKKDKEFVEKGSSKGYLYNDPYFNQIVRDFAERVLSKVIEYQKNIHQYDRIIFTGGGASILLEKEIDFIREKLKIDEEVSITVDKNPQLTNIKGLQKIYKMALEEEEQGE